jgi:hypothetical protein
MWNVWSHNLVIAIHGVGVDGLFVYDIGMDIGMGDLFSGVYEIRVGDMVSSNNNINVDICPNDCSVGNWIIALCILFRDWSSKPIHNC